MKEEQRGCGSRYKPCDVAEHHHCGPSGVIDISREPKALTSSTEAVLYDD